MTRCCAPGARVDASVVEWGVESRHGAENSALKNNAPFNRTPLRTSENASIFLRHARQTFVAPVQRILACPMERGSDASPAAAIQEEYRLTRRKSGHNILVMARKARRAGEVAAAEFKARCLELMDRVRETGAEYVITKHGLPVAKLVPVVEPRRDRFFGSMKGTVLEYERPLDPLDEDYEVNRG